MDAEGSSPTDETSPPVPALQWARVHQLIKQHGLTGVILILLAYQMGLLGQAQTGVCGL
jgi:hypothetical protein